MSNVDRWTRLIAWRMRALSPGSHPYTPGSPLSQPSMSPQRASKVDRKAQLAYARPVGRHHGSDHADGDGS